MLNKKLKPINSDSLVRIGNKYDGGYVVPLEIIKISKILLSAGLSDDWTFESQFKKNPTANLYFVTIIVSVINFG